MLSNLRVKIGSVAHVQEAVRGMLIDEILADIAALDGTADKYCDACRKTKGADPAGQEAYVTVPKRLDELIAQHGTLRAAARVIEIDVGYLSRLRSGEKGKPGKDFLRRMGLRGLDPALFKRPKSGFVLPFNRWIRRGLKDTMDQTLRDPQAIAPAGLDPVAVERLWRAFLDGAPGMYWSRVWSVYVFIRWCHRNRVFR
jgi:hypothetical protein